MSAKGYGDKDNYFFEIQDKNFVDPRQKYIRAKKEQIENINKAVDSGDFETVFELSKKLKDPVTKFGFTKVSDFAKDIEFDAKYKNALKIRKSIIDFLLYLDLEEKQE